MTSRRRFMTGALAASVVPVRSWAAIGDPQYLSAARRSDGTFVLVGLRSDATLAFEMPLPARGHAAAAHPERAEAVAFARRPGTYAIVLDCSDGSILARLEAPRGRHFYGHGVFSKDGARLYTTENNYESAAGVIGVWDAGNGYRRLGEFSSGGVGPHEVLRLPGKEMLVVANGGIHTHPESGREKLNLRHMRPNLTYLDGKGTVVQRVQIRDDWHLNSIRHLAVDASGQVGFAMQWQGEFWDAPPLLGLHRLGETARFCMSPEAVHLGMKGYAGSVAYCGSGMWIAISSPRGGYVERFDALSGAYLGAVGAADVCGISGAGMGMMATTGDGHVVGIQTKIAAFHPLAFDNHLVAI
ncbi:hypothetical protein shim_01890 [Shimia sp. SK013]|uniref:DUF1513 domain-containing protein n=1 Tax=Shimia sp. SK013 TaxID=1389006 RepID=UPI0006B4B3D5|nr:DUF1513 domain-containing protein [Shimia sp. SK013]KPA23580.1 hypothetical protein shim_01890 [Shimia sp. SK013]